MRNTLRLLQLALLIPLLLSACSPSFAPLQALPRAIQTAVQPRPEQSQPTATLAPSPVAQAAFTPTPAAASTALALKEPPAGLPDYSLAVRLDYDRHIVQVAETISGMNPEPGGLKELVLVVEASRQPDVFALKSLNWGPGKPIDRFDLKDGKIVISLDPPLGQGASYHLELSYDLNLKPMWSFLGYTPRQLNLGDWYPFVPEYKNGEWQVHDPSPVGEHLVYPAAAYHVRLVLSPSQKPLVIAASASGKQESSGAYAFEMRGARGFAVSASPDYQVLEGKNGARAYVFSDHLEAGKASLKAVEDALALYSQIYSPYPYQSMSVVEAEFFDGMEYSGLFFLGTDYFSAYPGSPTTYLVPLSAHETAHQWWYSLVGDDPAVEPWLDEALATYSELLFYQKYYPDLVDWWREYRINRFYPQGKLDISIYDLPAFRPYVDAVYLRGALFLDALRTRVGDDAFFLILKDLSTTYAYNVITRNDFFNVVQRHTDKDISDLMGEYFR